MRPEDHDRLVQLIYAGICDDAAFQHALHRLATCHRCASAALIYTDRTLPGTDIAITYGPFSDPGVRARYELYAADDPAPQAMARLTVGEAAATDRLFTPEFMAGSRFLREFYRPLGLEEALGGPIVSQNGRTGIVAVHRGADRSPFDDAEIAGFGRLLPHFGQALALRRTFFAMAEHDHALAAALDSTAQGVLVVDRTLAVRHANARARAILNRDDGLSLSRTGQLRLFDPRAGRRLATFCGAGPVARGPQIVRVGRSTGSPPYLMRLLPGAPSAGLTTVLYVSEPGTGTEAGVAAVTAAFDLPAQAAALVVTLLGGGDLASHAAAAGISRNTAKFHLQTAFAATGTGRQVDLIRVVEGALRDLGHAPPG